MHEKLETLYELCETIDRELSEANEKIRKAGGKLSAGDVEYIDKLTHSLKSIKTTIAMIEAEGEGGGYSQRGYSMRYEPRMGSYYDDRGRSYARGHSGKRDGMGRYSRNGGYSYAESIDEVIEDMRGMMDSLPEEKRREVQRFVEKMDRM